MGKGDCPEVSQRDEPRLSYATNRTTRQTSLL